MSKSRISWLLLAAMALSQVTHGEAGCLFPLEFQGEFLTQSMTSREIAYTSVSILFDSIPSWGQCHQRWGKDFILSSGEGEKPCFKCVSIVARSANVLQLHSNELNRCHPTQESALAACPTSQGVRERTAQEMMFYKTRSFHGGSAITRTYCPLNGNFKFTYSINDGTEDDLECDKPVSRAGDCPSGYKFDLHFRGCSFPDFEMSFQCLGSWEGENGETYMSLLDTKLPQLGEEPRPRYRCALFKNDNETGLINMALSSDSTCTRYLYSAQDGYETLHLEKLDDEPIHEEEEEPTCTFPEWMQGEWEGIIIEGHKFTYRDESNFVTYKGTCLDFVNEDEFLPMVNKPGVDGKQPLSFLLKLRTECGAESYNCALFQRRDTNVMEFQLGISSTADRSNMDRLSNKLCSAENFTPTKWLTFGRMNPSDPPHCPLVGEHWGRIPDAEGFCAKSYADCNNPEVMFYTVYNCNNASEVYEEREYRCFGQWSDPETGLVYTYTQRRDIIGNECFVGVDIGDDKNIITEAGSNCERGHQPRKYGMTLERQSKCPVTSDSRLREEFESNDLPLTTHVPLGRGELDYEKRPVSPRLSTVQRVVIDGRDTPKFSLETERILDEIERQQEERYYGNQMRDFNARNSPNRNPEIRRDYEDIFTNEISDLQVDNGCSQLEVGSFAAVAFLLNVLLFG